MLITLTLNAPSLPLTIRTEPAFAPSNGLIISSFSAYKLFLAFSVPAGTIPIVYLERAPIKTFTAAMRMLVPAITVSGFRLQIFEHRQAHFDLQPPEVVELNFFLIYRTKGYIR